MGRTPFLTRGWQGTISFLRWFVPGLGVKRWFGLILAGVTMIGVGLGIFLLNLYRTSTSPVVSRVLSVIALEAVPRPIRVLIFAALGIGLIVWGIAGLNRSLLSPFVKPGTRLVDRLSDYRRRERGRRVVAIGGGHGLAALLRGLKNHTSNITAIVTVADDGGSSGALRRTLGVLPPGDIRNCLAALSDDETVLSQLFQYRFSGDTSLEGHSFGNLFITALAEITGSFEEAVVESGRVLAVRGRVLPSTLQDVTLLADVALPNHVSEVRVSGESSIPSMPGQIRRVWLEPNSPSAFPPAVRDILAADLVVIGPGSLYTSILPNLLVPDILAAVRASRALKIFVVNIATQPGETNRYNCSDHVRALESHIGPGTIDIVVCNRNTVLPLPAGVDEVRIDDALDNIALYAADLADPDRPWRHDSAKLAGVLMDLLNERTGPIVEREPE
jgi:uncharacterized cofD-like protein